MILPEEYIVQKFYSFNGGVKYLKHQQAYQGSCFICKEGSSWLKKKRCYYIVKDNAICCHNCGWYSRPLKWIQEVSGLSYGEICDESRKFEIIPTELKKETEKRKPVKPSERLPQDSINLFDRTQILFYQDSRIVRSALALMQARRLVTAKYRPKALYTSIVDSVHKSRLIIPFVDEKGVVVFYQSRGIAKEDLETKPKYLSKVNADKTIFNIDAVDPFYDYIFIFEGPINAFFCKNGVAVGGIQEKSYNTFTAKQQEQILRFPLHKKIWVLDSQWLDQASRLKTQRLIDVGETVFIWPEEDGRIYKDFNDIAIAEKVDEIQPDFILNRSYSSLQASLELSKITSALK